MNVLDLTQPADRNLGRVLLLQARAVGDLPGLLTGEQRYSFAQINAQVNRYAAGLAGLGLGPGDRVSIHLPSCAEFIFLTLAVNKLGAVWVPVNTDYKGAWLTDTINDSRATLLITDASLLPRLDGLLEGLRHQGLVVRAADGVPLPAGAVRLDEFDRLSDAEPEAVPIHYGDTSAILWTSGTTGKSKGVMVPHNVWIRSGLNSHKLLGTRPGDVIYNCLPLYNAAAWVANIYRALLTGVPVALDPAFSPGRFWDRIRFYGATETITLGAMHMFLWKQPERPDDADNTLRSAHVIPLPEELVAPFKRRFGIERIERGYGQSEANPIITRVDDGSRQWKPNAMGEVVAGIEVRMLDDEGREVAAGEVGEFCIKPLEQFVLFNGYFDNPEATAAAYFGQWYRTGDLGMRDADGDFFFVDRKSDFLRYKGRNVSSLQVESVALKCPGVKEVACFGIPSEELASESEIKLDVVLEEGAALEPAQLARFVNDHAPYFFVPRYIEFVESLPYTPTNKLQKYKLRQKGLGERSWDRMKSDFVLER